MRVGAFSTGLLQYPRKRATAAAVGALALQAAGGPGSLSPWRLYERLQRTATPIPVSENRAFASAQAGPVTLTMNGGDWVRWDRYFKLEVDGMLASARRLQQTAG